MKAFVTGATGFLGRYIVEQLVARDADVRGLVRKNDDHLKDLGVEMVCGDIRDTAIVRLACKDVDVVFHTAAIAGIWGPWQHFHSVNVQGTINVIEGCLNNRVGRLVYTSSPSVTFDGKDQMGVDETVPYASKWLAHYPQTKAIAEQRVLQANGQSDLLTCALRPHLIWGPRDRHLVPRLLDRARSGRLRRVGDGQNQIDTVFVTDAARAHLLAAEAMEKGRSVCGRAFFISQDQPVNCWDWINELLRLAGLPEVEKSISKAAAWRIGAVCEVLYKSLGLHREPPMTRFLAAQLASSHFFDIGRAREDFGYTPQISIGDGMRLLANSW